MRKTQTSELAKLAFCRRQWPRPHMAPHPFTLPRYNQGRGASPQPKAIVMAKLETYVVQICRDCAHIKTEARRPGKDPQSDSADKFGVKVWSWQETSFATNLLHEACKFWRKSHASICAKSCSHQSIVFGKWQNREAGIKQTKGTLIKGEVARPLQNLNKALSNQTQRGSKHLWCHC